VNYFQIDTVKSKITQAFADVSRPDLRSIPTLGCCEDHEADFGWYRRHSWQELPNEVSAESLDWVEFSNLHPVAFHYFVPGVLMGTLESVGKDVGWHTFSGDLWLQNLIPSEDRAEEFRRNYVSIFSAQQIDAVASCLELFQRVLIEKRGYADDDLTRALNEIWKAP
jgi:hypothetical protein